MLCTCKQCTQEKNNPSDNHITTFQPRLDRDPPLCLDALEVANAANPSRNSTAPAASSALPGTTLATSDAAIKNRAGNSALVAVSSAERSSAVNAAQTPAPPAGPPSIPNASSTACTNAGRPACTLGSPVQGTGVTSRLPLPPPRPRPRPLAAPCAIDCRGNASSSLSEASSEDVAASAMLYRRNRDDLA